MSAGIRFPFSAAIHSLRSFIYLFLMNIMKKGEAAYLGTRGDTF